MRKNLIFDFDGVLGDTYQAGLNAKMKMGKYKTREEAITATERYFTNKPNHTRNHTLTPEELQRSYDWTREYGQLLHEVGFGLFESFIAEIEKLTDVNIAIVSTGSQIYVLPAITKTDLDFTHILAYEDHHSKEEKIELVCRDWGVALDEVYYFTDTLADVYELRNLLHKDKLIGVTWGYCTKEQLLSELPPRNILNSPEELQKILNA